ncbi:MAG TPA: response regulator [Ktedonobacterales bacterium]|jgi:chemosensory pili system protein ChpA (sensor histidine kinase/response regulator)|nr:response regulator [Ktedonobacterales bacterium]
MNDNDVFSRFLHEMRGLLSAVESHCADALREPVAGDRRMSALREVARLAQATAALARTFDIDDLHMLAAALADAATAAQDRPDAEPFALRGMPGARDTLAYMRWRVERLAVAPFEAATASDLLLAERLRRTVLMVDGADSAARIPHVPVSPDGPDDLDAPFSDTDERTLAELALVESFASANVRARDPEADARLLAHLAEASGRVAEPIGNTGVPLFGGSTIDDDDVAPEFKRGFVKETPDDLRQLGHLIMAFEGQPNDLRTLEKITFVAHKIKGGAGTMGFVGLAHMAKLLERATTQAAQDPAISGSPAFLPGLGRFLGLLEQGLAAADQFEEPPTATLHDAQRLYDALTRSPDDSEAEQRSLPPMSQEGKRVGGSQRSADQVDDEDHEPVLRVQAGKLDTLMNLLSALAANRGAIARNRGEITRAQTETRATLERLREKSAQLTDAHPLTYDNLLARAQAVGPSRHVNPARMGTPMNMVSGPLTTSGALRSSWNSLQLEQYTEVDSALRGLAEVVEDVTANHSALNQLLDQLAQLTEAQEALARDIQDEAMNIRLARFAEFAPLLALSARAAAADLGKQIDVTFEGESVEIDRLLLQQLEQPLIQLVRNAVAHGIETPAERIEQGKPTRGNVWIHVSAVGAEFTIEVGDDGHGVNPDLLISAAIDAARITSEDAHHLSEEQAMSFMFQLGVTTLPKTISGYVGAMAGSGVGLADVVNTIHRLKGSITIRSDLGKGTTFQIHAPISLSVAPVLEVTAAGQVFALPFAMVEYTSIVQPEHLRDVWPMQRQTEGGLREWRVPADALAPLSADGAPLDEIADSATARLVDTPAYALAELLGFEQDVAALRRMVVIRLRGQSVGLIVEAVGLGDVREATVRQLPRPLQRRVVRGVIVRPEDGQVALLVDPQEALAERLTGSEIALRPAGSAAHARPVGPQVLIVDDSVTIRRTLEQTLTQAGFQTSQARDGYEAVEIMQQVLPRVIVLDIEMPGLSGFDVLEIMRTSPQYQQVRIVMLTSRAADVHREHALAKGADAYLVKPCPQETIVETIRRLLTDSESE